MQNYRILNSPSSSHSIDESLSSLINNPHSHQYYQVKDQNSGYREIQSISLAIDILMKSSEPAEFSNFEQHDKPIQLHSPSVKLQKHPSTETFFSNNRHQTYSIFQNL